MDKGNQTKRRAWMSIAAVTVLFCMLAVTTYALVLSMVSAEDNIFSMGTVQIQINGGKTLFSGEDMNIEPVYSAKKDFTVDNLGTADVYYRLYLENVSGELADGLLFQIYDGENQLYSAKAEAFVKEAPCVVDTLLPAGESHTLTLVVKLEESAGNDFQSGGVTFDLTADAVQAANNPDKEFE